MSTFGAHLKAMARPSRLCPRRSSATATVPLVTLSPSCGIVMETGIPTTPLRICSGRRSVVMWVCRRPVLPLSYA